MGAETILVAGGTGLLGEPVARQLLADGFQVRLLVRDRRKARSRLGEGFAYVEGDVEDGAAVDRAVRGCAGVHVSLGAGDPQRIDRVEREGTARLAAAAARHGVARLSYLTGSLIHQEYGEKIPEHRAKLMAEEAIRRSGVPYVFFRPTYFIDNLPRHVQVPLGVMSAVDTLFLRRRLQANLQLMGLLQRLGEHGDPAETTEVLGAATTTVQEWCERRASRRHDDG
jgi:uncharacterized protein YbjT (DUF2867 family)